MSDQMNTDKKPQPDPAEENAFFPSRYSLSQFTSPKSDLGGADYPNPYKGEKKVLMIGADERYLLTDNGLFFSTGTIRSRLCCRCTTSTRRASPSTWRPCRAIRSNSILGDAV